MTDCAFVVMTPLGVVLKNAVFAHGAKCLPKFRV